MKRIINRIQKYFKKYQKKPLLIISDLKRVTLDYINENKLYVIFILFAWLNSLLLQVYTVGLSSYFLKPMLINLFVIITLGSFHHLFKGNNKKYYLIALMIFFTAITAINSMYYNWYKSFATISILANGKFIGDVGNAFDDQILQLKDLLYIIILGIFVFISYKMKNTKSEMYLAKTKNNLIVSLCLLIVIVPTLSSTEIGRFVSQWNREYVVSHFGIYAYQMGDTLKSIEPTINGLFGYDKAIKNFSDYFDTVSDKPEKTNKYTNILKGKNIIGIHAESLQNFNLGLEFNGKEVTPNLNKLIKNSLYFSNFYSQVSVGTSSDTEFTLNSSLMPTTVGTVFTSYFNRTFNSMPNLLKEKGYNTYVMHGNKASFWNRDNMYPSLGYDTFYSREDYDIDEIIGLGLSDKSFFKQSIEKLKAINEKGKPFYTTLISLTNHTPFSDVELFDEFAVTMNLQTVDPYGRRTTRTTKHPFLEETKLGRYIRSVHYADQALGQFINDLETSGLMENTVLVIYGDHDARLPFEDFNKLYNYDPQTEGVLDETQENYTPFGEYQYELNRKVPLIIYSKEIKETYHQEVTTAMGMIDVMPTLGNMFDFYNKYQLGNDIFNITDNTVVFSNGNFLTNKVYYNSQKNEYFVINNNDIITEEYIRENQQKADKILSLSSDLIIYDLIKREREDTSLINEESKERITPINENKKTG